MKAVKKLKFWSRKKKKKKNHQPYYPPPPPPCYHCCGCSSSTEPSAPPLPPWLEAEQNYGTFLLQPTLEPAPELTYPSPVHAPSRESVVEPNPVERSSSYQQYMVPEPVYGIPITQTATRERSGELFGCVFSFGAHLFRCLFPCFHIREQVWSGYAWTLLAQANCLTLVLLSSFIAFKPLATLQICQTRKKMKQFGPSYLD